MRFSDTFTAKAFGSNLRLSVRSSDHRIDEFYVPYEELAVLFSSDLSSKIKCAHSWAKLTQGKVALGLARGGCWCVFLFKSQEWAILEARVYEAKANLQLEPIEQMTEVECKETPRDFTLPINLEVLMSLVVETHSILKQVQARLNQLEINSIQIQSNNLIESSDSPEYAVFETQEFVPTISASSGIGSVSHSTQKSEQSASDIAEKLREAKKGKNGKGN